MKYILLWTDPKEYKPLINGSSFFQQCEVKECFGTANRSLLDSITDFDLIQYELWHMRLNNLPTNRSPHQIYMMFMFEAPIRFPVDQS